MTDFKRFKYSVILNEIRAYQWQEHVYIRQQSIVLSLWGTVSLTLVLLSLSLFCAFIFHCLPLCPSAPHRHHPPIENSKSGGLGLYAAWPHCCYQLQPADLEWCHPSLPSSSTVCKTTPVYMCVPLMCVCVCVCVCVRACGPMFVCVAVRTCQGLHASARKLQVLVCLHSRLSLQPQSGLFSEGHILLRGFFLKPHFGSAQRFKFKNSHFELQILQNILKEKDVGARLILCVHYLKTALR